MAEGDKPARSSPGGLGPTPTTSGLEHLLPFALRPVPDGSGLVLPPVYTEPAAAGECALSALANGRNLRLAGLRRRIHHPVSSLQPPDSNRYKGANRIRCNVFKTNEGDQF
jgi:hypothetical protein